MKIISFANLKGGAGKTMNAYNISAILSEKHKVLLIDVDPQCNLTSNCRVDYASPDIRTIKDVFDNTPKEQPLPEEIVYKSPIEELPNLDLIPSHIYLHKTTMNLFSRANRERILASYLEKYKTFFSKYDYIIIDTNPSISFININAFFVSDHIILCSDVSKNAIDGAELFCSIWDELRDDLEIKDNISALLIGNYDQRIRMASECFEYAAEADFSSDILLKNYILSRVNIKETELLKEPININSANKQSAQNYRNVIKELEERGVL